MKCLTSLLLIALVLCYVHNSVGETLKCYTCQAMVGSGDACEDGNTDYMFSAPCEPDVKECVSETFKGSGDAKDVIVRHCGQKDVKSCDVKDDNRKECESCSKDLCNAATGLGSSLFVMLLALFFKFYY